MNWRLQVTRLVEKNKKNAERTGGREERPGCITANQQVNLASRPNFPIDLNEVSPVTLVVYRELTMNFDCSSQNVRSGAMERGLRESSKIKRQQRIASIKWSLFMSVSQALHRKLSFDPRYKRNGNYKRKHWGKHATCYPPYSF